MVGKWEGIDPTQQHHVPRPLPAEPSRRRCNAPTAPHYSSGFKCIGQNPGARGISRAVSLLSHPLFPQASVHRECHGRNEADGWKDVQQGQAIAVPLWDFGLRGAGGSITAAARVGIHGAAERTNSIVAGSGLDAGVMIHTHLMGAQGAAAPARSRTRVSACSRCLLCSGVCRS